MTRCMDNLKLDIAKFNELSLTQNLNPECTQSFGAQVDLATVPLFQL